MALSLLDPGTVAAAAEGARTWCLILHTLLTPGHWHSQTICPYTEARCNEAAMMYEAQSRLSIHELRDDPEAEPGERPDPAMVWKGIALCIPAPDR